LKFSSHGVAAAISIWCHDVLLSVSGPPCCRHAGRSVVLYHVLWC